ncbi:MAG: AraC family transcriptional regulator [Lentisphaeria bacterium]|nr:AraC family transcriptional regulator [Lentisphaeria bacterium]
MELKRHYVMAPRCLATGFFVRGTGHFVIRLKENVKTAPYCEIFWCAGGTGTVRYGDGTYALKPGSVFYFPPGSAHDITPGAPYLDYHWLSIDGPRAAVLFESLGIGPGLADAGPCPEELFSRLEEYLQDSVKEFQLKALNTAFEILTRIVSPRPEKLSLLEQVKSFIDGEFRRPELDVAGIAGHFHLHRVSLSRMFRQRFGIPPGAYLASRRVQAGMALLGTTSLSVKEIASRCGFASADYFSKVIRRAAGAPPTLMR